MRRNAQQKNEENSLKLKRKRTAGKQHTQFYYSFLTIVLLICLVQMSFSALLNVTKVFAYHRKISILESKRIDAEARNVKLKKDINNFSTTASMESIARNNLKMAGKDELLVTLKPAAAKPEESTKNHKHKKIGHKK